MRVMFPFFLLLIFSYITTLAQERSYVDAKELTMIGKVPSTGAFYHRVDTSLYREMPDAVKNLYTHSAGLAIMFKTNSPVISAKWVTADSSTFNNMTGIAYRGLDLYIKRAGKVGVCRSR